MIEELYRLDQQYLGHPWSMAQWTALSLDENDDHYYYIHKQLKDDEIFCFSLYHINILSSQAHLLKILCTPRYRNCGFSKKLLIRDFDKFLKIGIESIYLEVHVENSLAIALYQSIGFTKLNRIKSFYSDHSDAFAMNCIINNK